MQLGIIGLGRMGANMTHRLARGGHACVVFDANPRAIEAAAKAGALPATSLADLVHKLRRPRTLWRMVPAGVVESMVQELVPLLDADDVIIDGGDAAVVEEDFANKLLSALRRQFGGHVEKTS